MDSFYKFASESPWLTFFLFAIVAEMITRIFQAFARIFYRKN